MCVCMCSRYVALKSTGSFGPDRTDRCQTEENRPGRFPAGRGGGESHEIFTSKLQSSIARCIIAGRETSVIYHKLCELLAQKLDSVN